MKNSFSLDRRSFVSSLAATTASSFLPGCMRAPLRDVATPSASQLLWHEQELGMFFHFDLPIWKPGWNWRWFNDFPSPSLYNPTKLDTDQWMEAAKAMGAKYVVFVAKHCSGFLQWQSDLYQYGVKQSPWRNGKGDVVKMFCESARRYGLKPGLYASTSANGYLYADNPGIVGCGKGDPFGEPQKRYVKICENMMTELWTRYGDLFEIWFDGGVLPPEQGGPDLVPLLQKYQPNAVLFQGPANAQHLLRWVGNERGVASYPCWGATDVLTSEGGDTEKCFAGDPFGRYYAPGECDVPIRCQEWFWSDESKPHKWRYWTDEEMMEKYLCSVGRGCNLLLNANPNTDGLVPEADMAQYRRFGEAIRKRYAKPLGSAKGEAEFVELRFTAATEVNELVLQEDISRGQRILEYVVEAEMAEGGVKTLCRGTAIGHKRIESFAPTAVRALRVRITDASGASALSLAAFRV